jgi:hypothetical protein
MVLSSDAFLFGRVTYEMLAGYWPKVKNNDDGDLSHDETDAWRNHNAELGVMTLCYKRAKN